MKAGAVTVVAFGIALCAIAPAFAQTATPISIIRAQHMRLPLPGDIQRFAVGDGDTLSVEALNSRELLLLGKSSGRTTLLIWFRDGTVQQHLVTVHRDLSVLEAALLRIHPSIRAELAPDRDAVILTGLVPDLSYSQGAERLAQDYMGAARVLGTGGRLLVADNPATQSTNPPAVTPTPPPGAQASGAAAPTGPEILRVPPGYPSAGTVINMIRLENLPLLVGDKILSAIEGIGGRNVRVRRVMKGDLRNDLQDIFILEGRVANQVALTRILTVAAQVLTGQTIAAQDIRVVADEAGALTTLGVNGGAGASGGGGGGGGGGLGGLGGLGGGVGGNLTNQVRRNVARAKILEAAGGRIVSFLEVADLPQVRVAIRLMELNRAKLKSWQPNFAAVLGSRHVGAFDQHPVGATPRVGPSAAIENILSSLGGSLVNETQVTAGKFALDMVLSLLEQNSIARTLSSPSLTVLSGEQAEFQVGGSIPVPESFSPTLGSASAAGVFNTVNFVNFGISLNIRPLVGDDDTVTLDIAPVITAPDITLTASLRDSTGTNPLSTAFLARALRTSARLQDGQALLVGGLLTHAINDSQNSTPAARDLPGLGWLFKNLNRTDDSTELVLVVDPVIVRDPLPNVSLWEFPGGSELMQDFGKRILASQTAIKSEVARP